MSRPTKPAPAPIQPSASIWNGSHGPMPPVMMADTAIAHRPRRSPNRGPNAAPARTTRKKMPLPPPGRSMSRRRPAHAASMPSSAIVAPFMVPRRTSSITAATTSAPTAAATSGASPLCAWLVSAVAGSQNG